VDDNPLIGITPDQLETLMQAMPEGFIVKFDKDANFETRISGYNIEDRIHEWAEMEGFIHIVGMGMRIGTDYFCNYLEETFFPPMTPANDEYGFAVAQWNGLKWFICTIPADKKHCAEEAAAAAGLKIQDAVPFMAGPIVASTRPEHLDDEAREKFGELDWFPLNTPATYTLEGQKGSAVYDGPAARQDLTVETELKRQQLYEKKDERGEDSGT
jgi:hypothetical protein